MESSNVKDPNDKSSRRLVDHLKLDGRSKVHSLVDKIYHPRNLQVAWERVRANKGGGGIDGISLEEFERELQGNLQQLFEELRDASYRAKPVRRVNIPKLGQSGETRPLGIPTIYDRVCQQAVVNKLEPIFEEVFDESSFGYRKGRSQRDALGKIWREINEGSEWIVDADLKNYFGSVSHEKLITLINQRVSDGRVLKLIEQMLKAGVVEDNKLYSTEIGTPQGGVVSPCLSNIFLTPFDKEMRRKGYRLTRWADDWVITCKSRREAEAALLFARKVLATLGVIVNEQKTRIMHIRNGFVFLGFKIGLGKGKFYLEPRQIKAKLNTKNLYAMPADKSVKKFRDQIRALTRRGVPSSTEELIQTLNPVIRGWGNYFARSNVRRLFNMLDRWIEKRIWSHHNKRWRCAGWKTLPMKMLIGKLGLVRLVHIIPEIKAQGAHFQKAVCGKTARTV
jgi:group II intron reverse transcriptase/maturase